MSRKYQIIAKSIKDGEEKRVGDYMFPRDTAKIICGRLQNRYGKAFQFRHVLVGPEREPPQ